MERIFFGAFLFLRKKMILSKFMIDTEIKLSFREKLTLTLAKLHFCFFRIFTHDRQWSKVTIVDKAPPNKDAIK